MPLMDGIITNTMANKSTSVHMKHLGTAVLQQTGLQGNSPVMDGVITNTKHAVPSKNVPELHKVHHVGKTKSKSMGQVPYAGPMY